MKRLLVLRLEYDGSAYAGWQRQPNVPSIQETLEDAIRKLTGKKTPCVASGRTDAGVHAAGQVVHFRISSRIPIEKWVGALNAHLPDDIAILEVWTPRKGFHAQFSAKGKTYAYTVWNERGRSALLRDRAWHIPVPLNVSAMRRAARLLEGRHDFRAFAQAEGARERKSTVRTLKEIRIRAEGPRLVLSFSGNGFLTHMVRILAGTLVEVGKGRRKPSEMTAILKSRDRRRAGITAPPQGLCLMEVRYR